MLLVALFLNWWQATMTDLTVRLISKSMATLSYAATDIRQMKSMMVAGGYAGIEIRS